MIINRNIYQINKYLSNNNSISIDSKYFKLYHLILPKEKYLTGVLDLDKYLLILLPTKNFINLSKVNKTLNKILKDDDLWRTKVDYWFPDFLSDINSFYEDCFGLLYRELFIRLSKGMKGAQYHGWLGLTKYFNYVGQSLDILGIPDIDYLKYWISKEKIDHHNIFYYDDIYLTILSKMIVDPDNKIIESLDYLYGIRRMRNTEIYDLIIARIKYFPLHVFEWLVKKKFDINYTHLDNQFKDKELLERVNILLENKKFPDLDGDNNIDAINNLHTSLTNMFNFIDNNKIILLQNNIDDILNAMFNYNGLNQEEYDQEQYEIDDYQPCFNKLFDLLKKKNFRPGQKFLLSEQIGCPIWIEKLKEIGL